MMFATKHFSVPVVGVTFIDSYPDNLLVLADVIDMHEHPVAVLIRNPDNQHDPNAVEVHIPALGENAMIGHLPAGLAARLAPLLDAGETWAATVKSVNIMPGHEDRPGITIDIEKKEPARVEQ